MERKAYCTSVSTEAANATQRSRAIKAKETRTKTLPRKQDQDVSKESTTAQAISPQPLPACWPWRRGIRTWPGCGTGGTHVQRHKGTTEEKHEGAGGHLEEGGGGHGQAEGPADRYQGRQYLLLFPPQGHHVVIACLIPQSPSPSSSPTLYIGRVRTDI